MKFLPAPFRFGRRRPQPRVSPWLPALLLALMTACGPAAPPQLFDPQAAAERMPNVIDALQRGQPEVALQRLDELAAAGPLPDGADTWRAMALHDAGRIPQALSVAGRELARHPGNAHLLALRGQLLAEEGRLDEALRDLALARELAPGLPAVQLASGRLALLRDDDELAARAFRDYLLHDPYGPAAIEAHVALAQVLARRGPAEQGEATRHQQTAEHLRQLHSYLSSYRSRLADHPDDLAAAFGVATAYLNLYVNMGQDPRLLGQAESALQHLLTLAPEDVRGLYNLGFVRAQQRRFDEALQLSARAVALEPDHVEARLNLALLHARLGQRAEAIEHLEQLAQRATRETDRLRAHFELGQIHAAGAGPESAVRALQHYREALELGPPDDPLGLAERVQQLADRLQAEVPR